MGEVYRARDTRLERTVAIKILPADVAKDALRKQRFEREAKTISSLNHPNICTLHDIGSQDGVDYLVMECVEGETLAKRLEKGPLPLERVLKYGAQIADALDKAHRAGIVHRDLKPGNIMLAATGAKLLDFGLAKPAAPLASLATMTLTKAESPVTQQGTIVGTFQYMSPEQVEGKEVDGRSDIFSLGAVLYEMVTGKHAFDGKGQFSVASAILEKEPAPVTSIKPLTPPALDHALKKCLAKQPEERWQSASDLASELKWVGENGSHTTSAVAGAVQGKWRRAWLAWAVCAAGGIGLLLGAALWRGGRVAEGMQYFSAAFPFPARDMAIAPNGRTVAVVAYQEAARQNVIWLYELGAREARSLGDTEGANFPFWSPDGNSLGFFADGKLKRLEMAGGPVHVLCDAPSGRGGTWNKDGVILFTPSGQLGEGIHRIPAGGGTTEQVSMPDTNHGENTHRWPQFLPDGKHYLYLAGNVSGGIETDGLYVGALDSKERKFVTKSLANGTFAEPRYVLFYRDKTLFAQRFDLNKMELSGDAAPLLTDVQYLGRILYAVYAASGNGLLLAQNSSVSRSRLVWYDRKGNELGSVGKPDVYSNVALSPDGRFLAVDKTDVTTANTDVWVYDLQGESEKRLTFDPGIDALPVWGPDRKQVAFTSSRRRLFDIYIKEVSAGEAEKELLRGTEDLYSMDWSPDGKTILYLNGGDFWTLAMPERKGSLFIKATGLMKNAQFSPNGKWVAYASNESGKWEIYVTNFPEAKAKWQVSNGGGEQPRWRADGKELFFLSGEGKMVSVPVRGEANFDTGAPVELFQANPRELVATSEQLEYAVTRDGQRFLINTEVKGAETRPMSIVMNWDAELKKK